MAYRHKSGKSLAFYVGNGPKSFKNQHFMFRVGKKFPKMREPPNFLEHFKKVFATVIVYRT